MANEKPLKLDMPFAEALRRFAQVEGRDLPENVKLREPAKAPRVKKKADRVSDPPSE